MTRCVISRVVEAKQVSLNPVNVSSVLNLDYEEDEEKLVFEARVKRPRLDQQIDWQWEEVDSSYYHNYCVFGLYPSSSIQKTRVHNISETYYHNYCVFGLYPSSSIQKTRVHNISETGSQSILALSKGPSRVSPPSPEDRNV
jgi:hypothetical protein